MSNYPGPSTPIAQEIHASKYRQQGETFKDYANRVAGSTTDSQGEFYAVRDMLGGQRFLPGGRIQSAMGSVRDVTAMNCFVSGTLEDSMDSIMQRATEAAQTMRRGGGIGYDFSPLRPMNDLIVSLDSKASGPVSFMRIFDAVCQTIASAGHRRGAQMAVIRIDHPDIYHFIRAKRDSTSLTGFNISVGVTDEFMMALRDGIPFALHFGGRVYEMVNPQNLWDEIMRSTWDWAEPGVIFLDQMNRQNNLWYVEDIAATNPCGEQPLGPYGACLLGSFNLTKYVFVNDQGDYAFDTVRFGEDIPLAVRMLDNVIDRTSYPLEAQRAYHQRNRRMGIGVTGLANAGEALGFPYGSPGFLVFTRGIMRRLRDAAYHASVDLAIERGPFPDFEVDGFLTSGFALTLPDDLRARIEEHGIRNSHLLSIAPTGTISLTADNVSSGIEPPFLMEYNRTIQLSPTQGVAETVKDYAWREWGIRGRTADECTVDEHLAVLIEAQKFVDSSCSKTCNVGPQVSFREFKDVYRKAWEQGAKGITTFRATGKRFGILQATPSEEGKAEACFISPETGQKECS